MKKQIVECVPNISEGRNKAVIDAVIEAIKNSGDVNVIDVDPGYDTNRTVITIVGEKAPVFEAAFACIKKSQELIDMSKHTGAHPRQGCTDVCPFVPVSGITMDECAQMAKDLGERVGDELGIPVYLYGYAGTSKDRQNLAFVRKGEYEALSEKLKTLPPDFGTKKFDDVAKKSGAVNISARDFLIAYNINLNTRDTAIAKDIAFSIREAGRAKRDKDNNIIRDENGKAVKIPGLLKGVKGIGWYIEEYGIAQLSFNLTNYKDVPLWKLFETAVSEAEKRGVRVTGSELVGLLPKDCIIECGKHFLSKAKRSTGVPERELMHIAIKSLGLDEITKFDIDEKVIEYKIAKAAPLGEMKLKDFIDEVGKDSPAPGGGSVAALAGALGAGLGSMVAALTPAKKGFESTLELMDDKGKKLSAHLEFLKKAIDEDTDAFNDVMSAMRMPKKTDEDKKLRDEAIQTGYKIATSVPFATAEHCVGLTKELIEVGEKGNPASASDVGVGALMAYSGFESAILNVEINLPNITDDKFKKDLLGKIDGLREEIIQNRDKVLEIVKTKI